MGKKYALLIGLNWVNDQHYAGWTGALNYAEDDVKRVNDQIIRPHTFQPCDLLLRTNANRKNVLDNLKKLAFIAVSGDLVVVYYTGHGAQIPDNNGIEVDQQDETWCLYDGQLIDDELWVAWCQFKKGVRILLISDSCNSGTIGRSDEVDEGEKIFPMEKIRETYFKNQVFYDQLVANTRGAQNKPMVASLLTISACKSNQKALENKTVQHGEFTYSLLKIWNGGNFTGNYRTFYQAILKDIQVRSPKQTPQIIQYGTPDPGFLESKPFY